MVAWYKHDIPAWMDATEGLDDGPYRAFHIICQLIYLNEGPIRLNERGIAGRCNQHVLAFRKNLDLLVTSGKLHRNPDGTLDQPRANRELERIGHNRVNAGKGGSAPRKPLETKDASEATLQTKPSQETRLDQTRPERTSPPIEATSPPPSIGQPIDPNFRPSDDQLASCRTDGADDAEIERELRVFILTKQEQGSFSADWSASWAKWWERWRTEHAKALARAKPKQSKKKPLRALPADWLPPARAFTVAAECGEDVKLIEPQWRDYLASSGKLYADHDSAFCNFIRNQKNFNRGRANGSPQGARTGSIIDSIDRDLQAIERERAGAQGVDPAVSTDVVLSLPNRSVRRS